LGKTDIHGHVNSIFRRRKRKIERTTTGTEIEMANLPNIYGSNITTGKSSLDKVLPMMARDINVMKTSIVSLAKSQLGQKSKSEAYFAKAQQRENLYESQYGKKSSSSSSSPSKIGSSSKGGGLFDPQTGFFTFLKGIFNQLLKGLAIGGGLFGLKKLLDDPEIRTRVVDTLSSIFLGILGLLKDGAKLFTEMLDKNGPAITKALTETFVAVMGAVEASIRGLTDLLTGPDSKKIYDAIGKVFTAIGDAIVKVFSTKIDIKGIELPLGLVIAGLAALPAILSGFSLAIQRATAAALGFGAGAAVGGAGGAMGGIFSMIKKGIGLAIGGAILAYLGATAYNSWKKQNPDLDEAGQAIDPKSQSGTLPGLKDPSTGEIDPNKAGVAGAEVGTAAAVAIVAAKLIKSGKGAVPSPTTSPGGYPRGPMATPTPSVEPSRIVTPSSSGGGPRSSTVMGQRNVFPMEGNTAGRRAPLPPELESKADKIMKRIKTLSSKGKKFWFSFLEYLGKRIVIQYGTFKGLALITGKITGACIALIGAPFTAGASTLLGYGLLAADIYFLYTVVEDFFKENEIDGSPTPTSTNATSQIPNQTTSPTSAGGGDFDYDKYKNLVGEKESGNKYKSDNTFGYVGRYQFGSQALETFGELKSGSFKRDGVRALYKEENWVKPGGLQAFLNDTSRQDAIMSKYTDVHLKALNQAGVITGDMDGANVSARLYAAHHGGVGGAIKLFKEGKDTADKYLKGASVQKSALSIAQAYGGNLSMGVRLAGNASAASDSPRVDGDLLARNSLSVEEQKRLVVGSGANVINSYNVVNNDSGSKDSSSSSQVSSPFDEKMFFESMVKQLFV
jgi:hypothetical protein